MKFIYTLFVLLFCLNVQAQTSYFPPISGSTWDTTSMASLGWCDSEWPTLRNILDQNDTKAFIVLKDGKIVIEEYFDQFTEDSLWYWASAGKTMTSFLVGLAQQDGNLSINDLTSQHLGSGWSSAPLAKENLITIKNQLSMTTGLDDGNGNVDCTDDTCLQYLADAGTRWAYHNAPYTLLTDVIEAATGTDINVYVFQKLYAATGITGSYVVSGGYNHVFFSKPRAMARFGLMIQNKGNWNGTPVLTDTTYYNEMVNTSQNLNLSYGYLWWLNGKSSFMFPQSQFVFPGSLSPHGPSDMFSALGKNGQILNVVPSQNLVMVRMGNDPGTGNALVSSTFNDTIWKYFNPIMCNSTALNESTTDLVTIYPNPAKEIIHITGLSGESVKYTLTSINGQTVKQGVTSNSISIDSLLPGSYVLTLQMDHQTIINKRFIITL